MSFYSKSSKRSHYRKGNYGSNHYQKKGILGNLFNMFGSGGSGSGGYDRRHQYQDQHNYHNQGGQTQQPVQKSFIICKKCNANVPAGSKFCLECGEKINNVLYCKNCGEKQEANAKFCSKCGTKIEVD